MSDPEHIPVVGVSIVEAARIAGVGRSTIYRELAAGRLVAKKIGRRTIVEPAALQTWITRLPAYQTARSAPPHATDRRARSKLKSERMQKPHPKTRAHSERGLA